MGMKTILVVDDEEHIVELISYNLENTGYAVVKADCGEKALEKLKNTPIDLVLLDWMLPGMDGIEVLKQIRRSPLWKKMPIILLTAKNDEISKVVGLEVGADDYLGKPFSVHELLARIKALLRRSEGTFEEVPEDKNIIRIENIVIDKARHIVEIEGQMIELSLKEFELLYYLAKNRGIVHSRDLLLEKIWGYDYEGETRTVDVHISNLRRKLEKDDKNPVLIKTVRGIGYKLA